MSWLWACLVLLLLADAIRMRRRLAVIRSIASSDEAVSLNHRFLTAPGVRLDEATRRAASAYARAHRLDVLDLVPGDWPTLNALGLARLVDPAGYRQDRLAAGRTARHAMLVTAEVLERAEVTDAPLDDPVALVRTAVRLKRYACTSTDLAVAPGLRAVPENPEEPLTVVRELGGQAAFVAVFGPPLVLAFLVLALVLAPGWGVAALAAFHLEPVIALAGLALRPHDRGRVALLRTPLEIWGWLRLVRGLRRRPEPDPVEARRPVYQKLLEGGLDRFFEPRVDRCPLCNGRNLGVHLRTPDLLQHKPGRFTLEHCRGCGHIFQNPQLSVEGIEFYYRDFYDGLGERTFDYIFGSQWRRYRSCARLVEGFLRPTRWLDVGCGHGHFCCAARDIWPETRFDGVDFGESVDEAARRGWVDTAYRELFPELTPRITGQYDVVSMSHYLEHTRDPRVEIRAAHQALRPSGLLLIELPDPQCRFGRWLGRFWLPWFQPQHLNLLSVENLKPLLHECGFELLVLQRGEAHLKVDFFFAAFLFLRLLAPPLALPWRPRASWGGRLRRGVVWTLGLPLLAFGWALDQLLGSFVRRRGIGNAYRVLAHKRGAASSSVTPARLRASASDARPSF